MNTNFKKKNLNASILTIIIFNFKVVLPLLIGGIIYFIFRPKNLLMFNWLNFLGLTGLLKYIRPTNKEQFSYIPDWVIYSLPDGLWVFSYTFLMSYIWTSEKHSIKNFFFSFGLIFSVILEFCQYFKIISGNFDPIDLISITLCYIIPYFYEKNRTSKNHN